MVKIFKDGKEYTANSITGLAKAHGAGIVNAERAKRFLEKQGFDLSTLIDDNPTRASIGGVRKSQTIIEKLIDLCRKIDKKAIEEETAKLNRLVASMSAAMSGAELDEILKQRDKVEALKNPEVNLQTILDKVSEMWDEHQKNNQTESA